MAPSHPRAAGVSSEPVPYAAPADSPRTLSRIDDYFAGRFRAMASPCEVLVDTEDPEEAALALHIAADEAGRIERKYSRYLSDSLLSAINRSEGSPLRLDEETALLLDYADACFEMSSGLFDITSGVLRRVWRFDGGDRVPLHQELAPVLAKVGWRRLSWNHPTLVLPEGMELDLGGLGKEYAVDRAALLVAERIQNPFLVNFGGDLFAGGPRRGDRPWIVGVDDPARTVAGAVFRIELRSGGLATSGDARRFVLHEGRRLGHILDPRTGWPVLAAPRSVTVLGRTCLEAGTLSTMACLQGAGARRFLERQRVQYRIL